MIPKLIIQTGPPQLPLLLQAATVNVKLLHPDFEHRFYDDAMIDVFLDTYFPEYRAEYRSFPFRIQRYDFFRYLAIYQFGGFYLDTDMFLIRSLVPLSTLVGTTCVFPFEGLTINHFLRREYGMDWEIGNYAFGAAPGHPFLQAVIKNCIRAQKDPDWVKPMIRGTPALSRIDFTVLNTTGPGLVSRTLAENPDLAQTVTVLFPEDVCDSRNWNCFGDFGIHFMRGHWRRMNDLGFVHRHLAGYWGYWREHRALRQSRRIGKARGHFPQIQFSATNR